MSKSREKIPKKNIFLIGPSYIGKSTFASEFAKSNPEAVLISFQNYRNIIKRSNFNYLKELLSFVVCWRRVIFSMIWSRDYWHLPLIQRVLQYGFIHFLLLRAPEGVEAKVRLFDEDFIKKLMDSTPVILNHLEYCSARHKLSMQIRNLINAYANSSDFSDDIYLIADCPYSIAKIRAIQRFSQAKILFNAREFRNRYVLERRLYRVVMATLTMCKVDCKVLRTDLQLNSLDINA